MPMSKKHFEAFAQQMRNDVSKAREDHAEAMRASPRNTDAAIRTLGQIDAYKDAAENFASVASADNSRFQWSRFMSACGFEV
jgi:hypothetical protein